MTAIIERPTWGARFQDGYATRPVGNLAVYGHHSVTGHSGPNATLAQDCAAVRTVERVGQQNFGLGISYTFVIPPSGRIFRGVSIHRVSAHTLNRNTGGAAFCFIGNYETETLTLAQVAAAAWLFWHGAQQGWWRIDRFSALHRDVFATACPGKNAVSPLRGVRAQAPALIPAATEEEIKLIGGAGGGHGFYRATRDTELRTGPLSTNKLVREVLEGELLIAGAGESQWWTEVGEGLWVPKSAVRKVTTGGATDVIHHGMWPDRMLPLTGKVTNEETTAWREYFWRQGYGRTTEHLHRNRKQWIIREGENGGHGPELTGQYLRAYERVLRKKGHYPQSHTAASFDDPVLVNAGKSFLNSVIRHLRPEPPSPSEKYRAWKGAVS